MAQQQVEVIMGNNALTDTMLNSRPKNVRIHELHKKVVFSCMDCLFEVTRIVNFLGVINKDTGGIVMVSSDNNQVIPQCPSCEGKVIAYVVGG